jgi:hypothetical protein
MNKIEQLKSDIEKIEKGLNSSTTPDQFKEQLRQTLKGKKDELESLIKEKKEAPKKQEVTVKKAEPVKKEATEKQAGARSSKQILEDCRKILSKYNKEKKSAVERIKERKKQGKPARLTPSETVSKTAKTIKSKIVEMKGKTDNGLPISEVNKLSNGIIATVKSTLSGIKNNVEKREFINNLISEIRSLTNNLTKVAMGGGMFEDGGGLDLFADTDGATLQNVGGTAFSNADLTPLMDITNPMFAKGGGVDYLKKWRVVGITYNGQKFEKVITLGRMSDEQDVKNALRRMPDTNIREITMIKQLEDGGTTGAGSFADGGMMEKGGRYNTGRSWTLDRNQHNKSEKYERPINERKFGDGGINLDEYFKKKKYKFEDGGIADGNTEMLMSQIRELQHHTSEIEKLVNSNTKVEAWVVAKAERSATDLSDITHYIEGKKSIESENEKLEHGGKLASVDVIFENPDYNYSTSINPDASEEEIRKYFVGNMFDMGVYPSENFQKVIDIRYNRNKNYANGGGMEGGVDLFEDYDNIPDNVKEILEKYQESFEDGEYRGLGMANDELNKIGYTFEYYLDGQAYDLRKIGQKGKSEVMDSDDYADGGTLGAGSFEEGGSIVELKNILKQDYQKFVELLGENIKDKKFRNTVKELAKENKVKYKIIDVPCERLYPTQSEISLSKSLLFPLTSPYYADLYLKAENPIRIKNNTILTCDNGKYIIDGHHRWSQVYVLNPKALMGCTDFYELKKPIEGLKATQLGIATDLGYVPTQTVNDTNMLTVSETILKKYVNDNITKEVREVFLNNGIDNPEEHIWKNVRLLKTKNKPIEGASKRDFMPQTDIAENFAEYTPNLSKLADGGTLGAGSYKKGGETTFNTKVKSIAKSLLKRKKVSPKVQKDYGKTYDKKEAVDSAKRIAGAMKKKNLAKGGRLKDISPNFDITDFDSDGNMIVDNA